MLTQFEVDMICRAVEALGRIAKELTRIRSLMEGIRFGAFSKTRRSSADALT